MDAGIEPESEFEERSLSIGEKSVNSPPAKFLSTYRTNKDFCKP